MRRLTTFVSMLFLLLLTTCLAPMSVLAKVNIPQPLQVSSAYDLIQAVNDLRASYGLPAYQPNSILMAVAQAHSEYQASISTSTHYGPNGERPRDRALAAGYPVSGYFSENIRAGSNLSAQSMVNAWSSDDLHLGTMLSPNLTEVGGGVACAGSYCYYTLDAALPSGASIVYTPPASGTVVATSTSRETISSTHVVIPNTPNADGSIIHIVKPNDSLIVIAIAYDVPVDDLLKLNNLQLNSVIRTGQQLTICPAFTPTPTLPTSTPTRRPTPTSWPTSTATTTPTSTPLVPTPIPKAGIPASTGVASVAVIILLALLVSGVISWLGARGANK
jgi:LysM repeat protein